MNQVRNVYGRRSVGKAAGRYRPPVWLRFGRTPRGTKGHWEVRREIFKNPSLALLAQLVEQRIDNPKIAGSSPAERTINC